MKISWDRDWKNIESRIGKQNLESFINTKVIPPLTKIDPTPETKDGYPKSFTWPIMLGFIVFMVSFMTIESQMPRSTLGVIGSFILFPVLFISTMAMTLFLMRHKISEMIEKAQNNFLVRSEVLGSLAAYYNIDYIPTPGGASSALKMIAQWKHCPDKIQNIVSLMDKNSGLDIQSRAIRRSGLVMPLEYTIGSETTKAKAYEQAQANLQFEDGFSGIRNGIDFAVMEWEESRDDFSYHHLLIHMTLPHRISGWVEFKNKASAWPRSRPEVTLKKVGVPYSPFTKAYDIRASDQTEARLVFDPVVIEALSEFAANGPARGVAFDNHLVFDIRGDNRFELVNLATGQWSDTSIKQTISDIIQMLELVDATAKTFTLKERRIA